MSEVLNGPRAPSPHWSWWLAVLLLGACAGFAGMRGLETERSEEAPASWDRVSPRIPFRQPNAKGAFPPRPDAWNLDHYESLWGQEPVESLEVTAVVPDGAVQRILLCSLRKEGLEGPGVVIDRSESPGSIRGVRLTPRAQTDLKCEGDELPPPTDEPTTVRLTRGEEIGRYTIQVGEAMTECRGAVPKDGPAIVGGLRRTAVLSVSSDGDRQAPLFHPALLPVGLLLGGLVWGGLCWFERRLGVTAARTLWSSLPLLACIPIAMPEPERVAESLQLQSLANPWLALAAGVVPSLIWKGLHHVGRASGVVRGDAPLPRSFEPWAMALCPVLPAAIGLSLVPDEASRPSVLGLSLLSTLLVSGALIGLFRRGVGLDGPSSLRSTGALSGVFASAVLLAWAGGTGQREAAVLFGLTATLLAGVAVSGQVGGDGPRGPILRTLMVLAALSLLEGGVRHTSVVDRWVGSPDALAGQAADDAMDSFAALEQGGFAQVPRSGNPVAFPPRGDRTRVVVFGGSEVAGGPWNDGLESYFPARLQDLTGPEVEVLNQGVGDWTTFHIRLHVEQRLAELSPDVLVLYVGHNDLVETLPVSLAELHQHWQVHGTAGDASVLQELRLFQGLRALLAALLDPRLAPAVPVGDAAENLAVLAAASRATGSHMLLVKQGLSPDSGPLAAYHAMLEDLATAQDGVEVLDAATLLQEAGPGHFVDDRHLSTPGALLLAQALHQRLVELGWLPTGP